jgi:aldose 1-epimerase
LTWSEADFGTTRQGPSVSLYTLTNRNGMTAGITNYGGIITSLTAPDRNGVFENIVLGFSTLTEYEVGTQYFGALIGRYGNRIAAGRFDLDGVEYSLAVNNGPNHLHGGDRGFDKVVWDPAASETIDGPSLLLTYLSKNGEEGYPGNLSVQVRYTLSNDNQLSIEYEASTDKATPVNLTSHNYFNLAGGLKREILEHQLEINADYFTPVDSKLIPTGENQAVAGTPFDFRSARAIGSRIDADNEQIEYGGGYDHYFVVNQPGSGPMVFMARLSDPESGCVMEVHSTEPGLQFYSGNALDGLLFRTGLCLEAQHCPDSPNQPGFPSTVLRPGEIYSAQTIYSFF